MLIENLPLLCFLGAGRFGTVFKAVSEVTEEVSELAIKLVPAEAIDYLVDGEIWLVMQYCAGGSLTDMRRMMNRNFNEHEAQAIIAYTTLALQHVHDALVIHRDIKAGNILLTHDGKAKLADFGVSAQLINTAKSRRTMIGTPFWMAPELIQETSYNGKADVWSLGITILELVEGNPPHFNVHPMRAIFMIPMKDAPTLKEPEKWSPQMQSFVKQCLVKDMLKRSDAATLLNLAWITGDVAVVREGHGVQVLRDLVADNWDAIEASRVNQSAD